MLSFYDFQILELTFTHVDIDGPRWYCNNDVVTVYDGMVWFQLTAITLMTAIPESNSLVMANDHVFLCFR